MKFRKATDKYEAWLRRQIKLIDADVDEKHAKMRKARFPFLRATYYRWAQTFPQFCSKLNAAPQLIGVGDLHVENFGTWRDEEGRLAWGINDFDEAAPMPYTNDLVRLAASATVAIDGEHLRLDPREAAEAILDGYIASLKTGGCAFVLADAHPALFEIAMHGLRDPQKFWRDLEKEPVLSHGIPASAVRVMTGMFPRAKISYEIRHRVAGLGSLGRERYVAIGDFQGGKVVREAKALAAPATVWADGKGGSGKIYYQRVLDRAVRCKDPLVALRGRWIVRRLAPDCAKLDLTELPQPPDGIRLLHAMGFETANVHLASAKPKTILKDLKKRKGSWLHRAAHDMVSRITEDWEDWRRKA